MEFLKLYKEENRNLLYTISWLNKNIGFDKSIGSFKNIDLFSFLENINRFNYDKDLYYDDIYYILDYTQDSIIYIINNINKEIKREHKIVPISQAKEFDSKTALWVSKQDGMTIKDKLKHNKIKAVKRYSSVDTYENRLFKKLLKKLVLVYEKRKDLDQFDLLFNKIYKWFRSDDAKNINEYGKIIYNNILLHHKHYRKIFKSYKWINRLDETIDKLIEPSESKYQIFTILKFDVLSKLQFRTDKLILPKDIKIDREKFDIEFQEKWLLENINIENSIFNIKIKSLDEINFQNIKNLNQKTQNNFDFKFNLNRTFNINFEENNIYIDLFRLFPIVFIDKKIIQFPITIKQEIDNKIVNANNTKVIDLSNEFYTLPEILKNYDIDILNYFIQDLEKYFKYKPLYYILPDYVNIFDFSKVKKSINSYFPKNRVVPKSILSALSYIFNNKVEKDDTLIYIQKDFNNTLFVTPLLVRYDKELKNITNGLYLEKHPTKKLEEDSSILEELNRYFQFEVSQKILLKCLQSGIKEIEKEQIAFYFNENIIYLKNIDRLSNKKDLKRIKNIKSLFSSRKLFNKKTIEIKDRDEENLKNYKELVKYEKNGFVLWKEHLPKLAMGDMPMNGYFGEFILVDDNSEVLNGQIEIKEHFSIPANAKELSFPLILGDENINYEAYITSDELPLQESIRCRLQLKYNYEAETPYELIFTSPSNKIKPLKVKWREVKEKEYKNLSTPTYPSKKSWEDFRNFINKNGEKIDLLEWISKDFKNIIQIYEYLQDIDREEVLLTNNWYRDTNNKLFQDVYTSVGDIRIYYNKYIEEAKKITFNIEQRGRFYKATNIVSDKEYKRFKKSMRFPLYTIWKDGNSLMDIDAPNDFRILAKQAIESAISLLTNKEVDRNLKKELFVFLTIINKDAPSEIANKYIKILEDKNTLEIKKYRDIIPYSVACIDTKYQEQIFYSILELLNDRNEKIYSDSLKMLGIILWRCQDVIFKINKNYIDLIIIKLLNSLQLKVNSKKELVKQNRVKPSVVNRLELLLAILRYREKELILKPKENITKEYIKIIDKISKNIVENRLIFNSRVQLNMHKPTNFTNTPDLLYALRVYLSNDINIANSIQIIGVDDD